MPAAEGTTSLNQLATLDDQQRRRLRALSVTTVEELRGLAIADPVALTGFLGVELAVLTPPDNPNLFEPTVADRPSRPRRMGALPSPGRVIEEVASFDTIEAILGAVTDLLPIAAPAGPSGASFVELLSPVRDQGNRGTCVAHAVLAAFEYAQRVVHAQKFDGSEQFIYWATKQRDGHPQISGTWAANMLPTLADVGVCPEEAWAYNSEEIAGNESQDPPAPGAVEAAVAFAGAQSAAVDKTSVGGILAMLDQGQPVIVSLDTYQNWDNNPALDLYGNFPMPLPGSQRVGGHAMLACGYAADSEFAGGGYLILRNSWGSDWAPQSRIAPGYGLLPFAYIGEPYCDEAFTCTV
jgi:hypothetical protein